MSANNDSKNSVAEKGGIKLDEKLVYQTAACLIVKHKAILDGIRPPDSLMGEDEGLNMMEELCVRVTQIEHNIQFDIAGYVALGILEMQRSRGWTQPDGARRLAELVKGENGEPDPMDWNLWIENQIIKEAVTALSADASYCPFELTWINHLISAGQLELLDGDPCDGRERLIELYGKATLTVVEYWPLIEEVAAIASDACAALFYDRAEKLIVERFLAEANAKAPSTIV